MFWIFVRIASAYVLWGNKNKTIPFLHIILSIKNSLQQQIHYNGNIFGKKFCRCNEGSLYLVLFIFSGPLWSVGPLYMKVTDKA